MSKILLLLLFFHSCNGFITESSIDRKNDELFELSIIHMNDFHSRFVPINPKTGIICKSNETNCVGGLARVFTASRQLLRDSPNVIFLNAGDFYQGTAWHNVHRWEANVHFTNMLNFDVMTVGNHDFDDGIDGLVPFLEGSEAPFVLSNVDDSKEPAIQGLYEKSTIIRRGKKSIGVIGVIYRDVHIMSHTGKLKFLDEFKSVNSEAKKLKAKGVDIIIVLSHCGIDIEKKLAASCPDIDVIVGGHSHTLLYNGKAPGYDLPKGTYPIVVQQQRTGRTVLVVQAGAFTKYLGNLTVRFDSRGEVKSWEGNPIYLDKSIKESKKMLEELKPWEQSVHDFGNKVIGLSKTALHRNCTEGECTMGNLITDAMIYSCEKLPENPNHWTYAAIGCINAGSIRSGIDAGDITYGEVVAAQPFENTWDIVEIKGEDLLLALEEAVLKSYRKEYFSWKGFLAWSGIEVVYNLTNPAWNRVVDLKIRCQACEIPKYEELRKDDWYRVIVISNLLENGESQALKQKHRNRITGVLDIDALVDFINWISPVDYKLEQRIEIFGKIRPSNPLEIFGIH